MEPFNLSLQQVNFEEKDISNEDTLHAFSNLVSFESEFRNETSYGAPVIGKNLPPSSVQDAFQQVRDDRSSLPYTTESTIENSSYTSSGRAHTDSVAIEPSEDSFTAFTDTVEALALQKSVIGKSTIKPASEEEVLRVIAETQNLIQKQDGSSPKSSPRSENIQSHTDHNSFHEPENTGSLNSPVADFTEESYVNLSEPKYDNEEVYHHIQDRRPSLEDHGFNGTGNETFASRSPGPDQISVVNPSKLLHDSFDSASNASTKSLSSLGRMEDVLSDEKQHMAGDNVMASPVDGELSPKELIRISKSELEFSVERHPTSWLPQKREQTNPKGAGTAKSRPGDKKKKKGSNKRKHGNDHQHPPQSPAQTRSSEDVYGNDSPAVPAMVNESEGNHHAPEVQGDGANQMTIYDVVNHGDLHHPSAAPAGDTAAVLVRHVNNGGAVIQVDNRVDGNLHDSAPNTSREIITNMPSPIRNASNASTFASSPSVSLEESSLPNQVPSSSSPSRHPSGFTVDELLRMVAKLEGHIEMLETESSSVLKDRAHLQSQVATLLQQIPTLESQMTVIQADCADLRADKETLRQNQGRLEQVIMDAHKLLQDKDSDLRTLEEDLNLSHEANEKLQEKIKAKNSTILSREMTVQDMKGKITEFYVDLQMSNQNKLLADSENKSLQSEVKSLALAKEWYQDQLQESQTSKGNLQKEISALKSEQIGKNTMIERLKADNIRTKQFLADAEQRALSEKEKLAHHLEAIEAQMMEREVTFVQLQQQKDTMEATLENRLDKGAEDTSAELTAQLQKAQNELRRKQASIAVLEHEQADLMKRLALSQESILDRDKNIEMLGRKAIDLEVDLSQTQILLQEKVNEVGTLKDNNLSTEVELAALRNEKQTISGALNTLKQDMEKVESSFKHMKNELKNKQDEVTTLMSENNRLNQDLSNRNECITSLQNDATKEIQPKLTEDQMAVDEADRADVVSLKEGIASLRQQNSELTKRLEGVRSESSLLISELKSQNVSLEQELEELKKEVGGIISQENLESVQEIKESEDETVQTVSSLQSILSSWRDQFKDNTDGTECGTDRNIQAVHITDDMIEKVSQCKLSKSDIHLLFSQIVNINNYLVTVCNDTRMSAAVRKDEDRADVDERLVEGASQKQENVENTDQKSLMASQEIPEHSKAAFESLTSENEELRQSILDLQEQISVLLVARSGLESQLAQRATAQEAGDKEFVKENDRLRSEVGALQTGSHKEIAKQKAKALKLGKDLQATLKKLHEQKELYEAMVSELQVKFNNSESVNNKLEEELKASQARFSMDLDEKTTQLHATLQEVQTELSSVTEQKQLVENDLQSSLKRYKTDIEEYRSRNSHLEMEVEQLDGQLQSLNENSMQNQQLMLDLERERGRLAGLQQNHAALKEHTSTLEMALAQRDSSVLDASSQVQERLQRKEKEVLEIRELMEEQRQMLEAEKQTSFDTKKELLKERENHVKVRRQLETLWMEHDQLKSEVTLQRQEVAALTEQLSKAEESDKKHRSELEHMSGELRFLRSERDSLQEEVQGQRAKDPVLSERMQSLEWQVNEKKTEITALKDQLVVAQDRQVMEIGLLRKSLQNITTEVSSLREELLLTKQEKTSFQTRVAELKGALQTSIQHTKLLQKDGATTTDTQMTFDLSALENLLQDSKPVSSVSKPLSFLQATLNSLRGEISSLQNQVDEHATAVESSSKVWRELDAQVKDLREVCKNSAADRAASQKVIHEGYSLVGEGLAVPATESVNQ